MTLLDFDLVKSCFLSLMMCIFHRSNSICINNFHISATGSDSLLVLLLVNSQGHNLYKLKIYHLNQLKSPIISKKITYLRYVIK